MKFLILTCVGDALSFGKLMFPGLSCNVDGLHGVGGSLLPCPLRLPNIGWLCWTLLWWAALCCIGIPTTAPAVNIYLTVWNIWFFTMITQRCNASLNFQSCGWQHPCKGRHLDIEKLIYIKLLVDWYCFHIVVVKPIKFSTLSVTAE